MNDHYSEKKLNLPFDPQGNLIQTSPEEIYNIINGCRGGKALSVDGIPDIAFSSFIRLELARKHLSAIPLPAADKEIAIEKKADELTKHTAHNLAKILNHWLRNKSIPPLHMTSRLVFIYKDKPDLVNGNTVGSFRPISVTSPLFKLLEIIIHRRIRKLTEKQQITPIHQQQIGF